MKRLSVYSVLLSTFSFAISATADEGTSWQNGPCNESKASNFGDVNVAKMTETQLNWREAIGVSDDQEGDNTVFGIDSERTIILPIELASNTAPNKIGH